MKPVALLALLLSVAPVHAHSARDLFQRAVYSTCPTEQVELYTEALQLDPSLELGHHNLGAAYYRLGCYDKAIRVLDMALIADPTYANTHYLLACSYSRLGDMSSAMSHLRKAIRYGWTEKDMLASDTDLDALRGRDFPSVRSHRSSRKHSAGTGHRRSRRGSKAAAAAAGGAPGGAATPAAPPPSGQPDDQPAPPPPAETPAPPPQAGPKGKK